MGAGIAQVAAHAGYEVLVHDPFPGAWSRARDRIDTYLERQVSRGQLNPGQAAAVSGRLGTGARIEDLAAAGLVIEAIPEDLELKRDAFGRLDATATPDTVLATNTSSLSVAAIAAATTRPAQVVGMHFFNPVHAMRLVEVIAAAETGEPAVAAVEEVAQRLGKTTVRAADTPGFIVNRVARPFYLESLRILGAGLAGIEAIDLALRAAGFKMGPFELIDTIGLDVNLAVSQSVFDAFGEQPRYRPSPIQERLVAEDRFGRKAGAGFYDYDPGDGSRRGPWSGLPKPATPMAATEISARVLATIVNEAASALEDGIASAADIDTAMELGTNWPHGPLAWGEELGLGAVLATLSRLATTEPDGTYAAVPLLRVAAGGTGFGR